MEMISVFTLEVKAISEEGGYPPLPQEAINPELYLHRVFSLTLFGRDLERD